MNEKKVQKVLDKIRPYIQRDGGDVTRDPRPAAGGAAAAARCPDHRRSSELTLKGTKAAGRNDPLLFSCRRGQPVQLFFHLRAEAELLAVLHADIIDASDVFLIEQVDRT